MIATTTAGKIEGREVPLGERRLLQFRGVPYAAPPTGDRRFRPPLEHDPWSGVRDATEHGKVAPQPPSAMETMLGAPSPEWDEDCLTLTITTPGLDDGARPVLVWIHGGAFTAGSGSTPWYDGSRLAAAGDVVVVAINYRLGAFGFLELAHLLGDDYADSGTVGLHDQLAALRWVRDNIANFGGDPDRVTIFGESAGAMSIGCLLGSPLAPGLFSAAIVQSGGALNVNTLDRAHDVTAGVLEHAGLGESSADGLISLDAANLVAAQAGASLAWVAASRSGGNIVPGVPFQPVVSGSLLPQPPLDAVRRGNASGVRLVAGTTTEEWKLFALLLRGDPLDDATLLRRAGRVFGERGSDAVDTYRANRPGASPDELYSAMATDFGFRIPTIRLVEAQLEHARETYTYEFDHRSTAWGGVLGACHAIEIPFVFDNLDRGGVTTFVGELGDREHELARETSLAWLVFARGDEPWDHYDLEQRLTRRLGGDTPGIHADPHGDERQMWDGIR
jgi:para-nitrobenzyl esterase